jgi:hypothetical protein
MENDQLKVAKMMIYGWIKDWSCLTTYLTIAEKQRFFYPEFEEFCKKYPFFPAHWLWYKSASGRYKAQPIRRFIADLDKKLSDALWDTDDKMKKLKYADYLVKLNASDVKIKTKLDKEAKKMAVKNNREYVAIQQAYWQGKEDAQKHNGTHWTTVK